MNRRIERCIGEHERLGTRRQIKRDARVRRIEVAQTRDQPARAEGRQGREIEHAGRTAKGHGGDGRQNREL